MREIGVRELKATLSETLHAVAAGEAVRVTVRGTPLVDIVAPIEDPQASRLARLVAAGRVTQPTGEVPRFPPPLARSTRSASGLVLAERELER